MTRRKLLTPEELRRAAGVKPVDYSVEDATYTRRGVTAFRLQEAGYQMSKEPPYGYEADPGSQPPCWRVNNNEQTAVAEILYRHGLGWSANAIMKHLNADDGFRGLARGERWHTGTIIRIIKRHYRRMVDQPVAEEMLE